MTSCGLPYSLSAAEVQTSNVLHDEYEVSLDRMQDSTGYASEDEVLRFDRQAGSVHYELPHRNPHFLDDQSLAFCLPTQNLFRCCSSFDCDSIE